MFNVEKEVSQLGNWSSLSQAKICRCVCDYTRGFVGLIKDGGVAEFEKRFGDSDLHPDAQGGLG